MKGTKQAVRVLGYTYEKRLFCTTSLYSLNVDSHTVSLLLMITNQKLCRCNLNIDLKSGQEPKLMPKRSDVDTCLSELLLWYALWCDFACNVDELSQVPRALIATVAAKLLEISSLLCLIKDYQT